MNRKEFMDQLEKLLSDFSEDERREALDYYESYFDEAGEAEEASVIQKLGSPGKVAAIIKADLRENSDSAGTYTEKGYYDERTEEPGQVPGERTAGRKDRGYRPREKRGSGMMILVLILLVFLSPFLSGAIGGVVGFIGAGVIGLLVGGIVTVFAGIGLCFSAAPVGIFTVGLGSIVTAIGLVGLVFIVWVLSRLLPRLLNKFTDFCSGLIHREKGGNQV